MAERTEVDVVVIGLGVGGEHVATRLVEGGCSVVGIEPHLVGGECPYYGCVPTKMIVRAANVLEEARRVDALAGSATVAPDWGVVARRIRKDATDDWNDDVAVRRLEDAGVRVVRGRGRMVAPDRVAVGGPDGDDEFVATRAVVIAIGSEPAIAPIDGLDAVPYLTNRDLVTLEELPSSLVVMGGGAIGLEIAQATRRFGVEVTVVEAADRISFREEPEVSALLARVFAEEGIEVRVGAGVERVTGDEREVTLHLADGTTVAGQRLLVCTGRRSDLRALGVGTAGLDEDARVIAVDEHLRAAPGIYAIGDVTGVGAFTHVAVYHARIAAAEILGHATYPAETRAIPRVTFTDPEIGSVGCTEAEALEKGFDVVVAHADTSDSARGWMHAEGNAEFIKLVVDRKQQVLVGATAVGPMGGEVLSMLALAVHARIPVATLRSMIYAYPTFHRTIETALETLPA